VNPQTGVVRGQLKLPCGPCPVPPRCSCWRPVELNPVRPCPERQQTSNTYTSADCGEFLVSNWRRTAPLHDGFTGSPGRAATNRAPCPLQLRLWSWYGRYGWPLIARSATSPFTLGRHPPDRWASPPGGVSALALAVSEGGRRPATKNDSRTRPCSVPQFVSSAVRSTAGRVRHCATARLAGVLRRRSTGSERLSPCRETHRGRKGRAALATLPCASCFSVAMLSSIIRTSPSLTGRMAQAYRAQSAAHHGIVREDTRGYVGPGPPRRCLTRITRLVPLAGTGAARLELALKRAAHLRSLTRPDVEGQAASL
jgi:hypothetical protein